MRSLGSHSFIAGVRTRLKKYSRPIQMIPKIKCSQRRTIISFAPALPRKEKCGCHSGNPRVVRYKSMRHLCHSLLVPEHTSEKYALAHSNVSAGGMLSAFFRVHLWVHRATPYSKSSATMGST